jgi:hypothetical protein
VEIIISYEKIYIKGFFACQENIDPIIMGHEWCLFPSEMLYQLGKQENEKRKLSIILTLNVRSSSV